MKTRKLALKQLDRRLKVWRVAGRFLMPKIGWIKLLRKTLGMTTTQLAKRLSVDRSRIVMIEKSEPEGAITLRTLKGVAEALNCELVYALVPREPLEVIMQKRAQKVALQQIQKVAHSMALENQSIEKKYQQEQLKELIEKLLSGSARNLWDEE